MPITKHDLISEMKVSCQSYLHLFIPAVYNSQNMTRMPFCDDIINKLCFNSSFSEMASDYKSLVCFVDRCFVLLSFIFLPLCCLFFVDLRVLITPLVSLNSFYTICWYISSGNGVFCSHTCTCD